VRVWRPTTTTILTCAFVLCGLFWGGFLGLRQIEGIGSSLDSVENLTADWRFVLAGSRPAPRGVVIAAIDDETIREAGAYPLPRSLLARIVRDLAASNPQVIAVDIAFLDPGARETDLELADALRSARSVVAAIGQFDGDVALDGTQSEALALAPRPSSVLWPIAAIRSATKSGLANIATDSMGIPRYIPLIYAQSDSIIPSFALSAVSAALNTEPALGPDNLRLAARTTSTDLGYHLPIRYYGPRGSIRQFSVARILHGDLEPDEVRGQIVVLGVTAIGAGDLFATPFDRGVPGVEIFATGISNLLAGDGLVRSVVVRKIDAAAATLLPGLTILLMAMRRSFAGLGLASVIFPVWSALTFIAFLNGYWLSVAVPLAAVLPVVLGYGLARLGFDRHALKLFAIEKATLIRLQSSDIVDHILKHPRFLEKPVQQNIAAVFVDLSGFTGVAETLGPIWTRDLLADFQALIEREVVALGGLVVNFMGDGAMIVFGLLESGPDDASRAFTAVTRLHASIATWLGGLPMVAQELLGARIGGHFGPAVVSRLGSERQQHITATGDTVNVASRLLEVAKQQRCSVIVSEDLYAAAKTTDGLSDAVPIEFKEVNIRGRKQPLRICAWR
jgi:adenylate cyclase